MEFFVKLINSFQQLAALANSSILDVRMGSACAYAVASDEHQYEDGMEDSQQNIGGRTHKLSGKKHSNHNKEG